MPEPGADSGASIDNDASSEANYDARVRARLRGTAAGLALLGTGLVVHVATAAQSQPEAPRCPGRIATIVGTAGDDVLRGTPHRDVIWGGPGNDLIHGGRGNDLIFGRCAEPPMLHRGRGDQA